MLYIKLFIEREKYIGQSAPKCPFKTAEQRTIAQQYGDWYTSDWWVDCDQARKEQPIFQSTTLPAVLK